VPQRSSNATSLEVRIPISPRADYFNRVRLIAQSIREFYPKAIVRVTIGADIEPFDVAQAEPWSHDLGVHWVWVKQTEFAEWRSTAHPYIATMMERFRPPFFAEHVLMLDADVMPVRPFDELLERDHALLAMMAHVPPFRNCAQEWQDLFAWYGLSAPSFTFEHSGWGAMFTDRQRRFSPPYFNTGVVLARADVYERLYEPYMTALRFVKERLDSYFFEQIALTLALLRMELPFELLPLRYNFPNQAAFDITYPEELEKVRLLHFLRTQIVDRESDFQTADDIRRLVDRSDLSGSNEVLRRRIAELLPRWLSPD
jgi:hypothetical protein